MPTTNEEWLCRRIVQESQEAVIFADRQGIIRLWNAGAAAMFGYQAGEALGRNLDLIIPEKLRARHEKGYRRVMATGVTEYARRVLAVPGLRKDGARISLEFTLGLIRAEAGEVLGTAAIIREVTARWEREQEMKRRLADLEARLALILPPRGKE
jgi:PAS domain S-box-containing protein